MPILWSPPSGPGPGPGPSTAPPLVLRVVLTQEDRRLELGTTGSPVPSGSGAQWRLQAGLEGFDDPIVAPVLDQVPGGFGGVFSGMSAPTREIFLPVLVQGAGGDGWRAARRELDDVANPMLGETTITVTAPDNTSRSIRAYRKVQQPVQWAADTWSASGWQILPVLFEAADPWWRQSGGLNVEPWQQPATQGFFGTNFFPLRVLPAGVFGADRPLLNSGQVEARPVYAINASTTVTSTTVTAEHVETGRSWTLDIDGLEGTVTVDAASKRVTGPDGSSWWSRLAAPFDLWPLPVGSQTVRVTVTGTTTGVTVQQTGDSLHFRAVR